MNSAIWKLLGVIAVICGIAFLVYSTMNPSSLPRQGTFSAGYFFLFGFLAIFGGVFFLAIGFFIEKPGE